MSLRSQLPHSKRRCWTIRKAAIRTGDKRTPQLLRADMTLSESEIAKWAFNTPLLAPNSE
jgi:hypothetical protein